MSIQQAIEKAKQMHGDQQRQGVSPQPSAKPRRRTEVRAPEASVTHEFPMLSPELDPSQSRLLVSTVDATSRGPANDAYRVLRTKLRRRAAAQGWTRFGVTSAAQGDGKSTTAANLALSFALENRENVFLIDLDLRRPSLLKYFGIRTTAPDVLEIGSFLEGDGEPKSLFFTPGIGRLYMAGGTSRLDHSSELLAGSLLDDLFAYLEQIDPNAWVFVDLPPVLSTADVLTVAPRLSAVILVASEGLTRREDLASAAQALGDTPTAGVVLNRATRSSEEAYGYY